MIASRVQTPRAAGELAPYLLLAGIWLLTVTIVPPRGNFPLNDDWIYAKVVKNLVDTGRFEANPYADPTFIVQAYWGAAFVKVFGFSFESLRISTLLLALVAVWGAHWAAREAGLNARWAFLVTLTLLVNPLFLNLSYTFMTDVPFLALSLLSGAAYLRALRTSRVVWVAAGSIIAASAFFIRQFGALLPIAFALPLFLSVRSETPGGRRSTRVLWSSSAFLAPWLVAAVLAQLMPLGGLDAATGWDWSVLGNSVFARAMEIARHCAFACCYLSLFAVPLALAWSGVRRLGGGSVPITPPKGGTPKLGSRSLWLAFVVLIAAIAWLIAREWPHRLPNLGNVIYDFGVGPLLMPGMLEGDAIAAPARLGAGIWWFITALAIVAAASLIILHVRAASDWFRPADGRDPARNIDLVLALWSLGMILVLILPPVLARFDRYFVMAQVPATILVARWIAARRVQPARGAFVAAIATYFLGVVCLQDYLAWNAARWRALNRLQTEHGATLAQINGGYEFNGWFHSDRFVEESRQRGTKVFGPLGWWALGDDFHVSMRPAKRFEVIGTEPYHSWLGFARRDMLILRRTEPEPEF